MTTTAYENKAEAGRQIDLLKRINERVTSIDETVTDILDELKDGSHENGYNHWNSGDDTTSQDYEAE